VLQQVRAADVSDHTRWTTLKSRWIQPFEGDDDFFKIIMDATTRYMRATKNLDEEIQKKIGEYDGEHQTRQKGMCVTSWRTL